MKPYVSRRRFLKTSLVAGLGAAVLPSRLVRGYAANERINVALVGVGGRGTWFVDTIPRMENVVAVCDVDEQKIAATMRYWDETGRRYAASPHDWEQRAGAEFGRLVQSPPRQFRDFRRMLEELDSGLDAVVVATPDHTHAVASAAVMRAGKHVFCEKPLTRTIHESRALRELARKQGITTSMGNQGTYSGAFRRALELVRGGTIGQIREVHVWNDGGGADRNEPPQGEQPIPDHLDWDLWLGPAASRPFHAQWMQRHLWREFGTCQLGNWGSHSANLGFMALKVHDLWLNPETGTSPPVVRVRARTSGINRLSFPRWEIVDWEIPARGELPPITMRWYNGQAPGIDDIVTPLLKDAPQKDKNNWKFAGTLLVGTKGSLHTTGHNMWFHLLPAEDFRGVQCERPETVESSRGPEQDWFAACRGGARPWANFDYASALNEFLMLGNVATQFETPLEYEPVAMRIRNNSEADALLRCEYREGWTLEKVPGGVRIPL
jgi:hypothetical protein